MNNSDPILEELALAGQASPVTPMLLELDSHRITVSTDVPKEDYLMRMFGKPCFPRRDLTSITGVEKCGKTFFTSMLMACCAKKEVLALERVSEEPLRVLWYDTEQSLQSTKGIFADRVGRLVTGDEEGASFDDSNFLVFNVRSCTYQQRMDYLVEGIKTYKPDLVIIDNVCDLLSSINDSEESMKLIAQLMQLSTEYDCNISVVIHLNRTGDKRNLRGWLGTEILHKSFEVYYCEHIEDTDVFMVEQTMTRKYQVPEKLYYTIDEEGLPVITEKPDYQPRNSNGQYMSNKAQAYKIYQDKVNTFNQQYIIRHPSDNRTPWEWDVRQLFNDAMDSCAMMSIEDLRKRVMEKSGIQQPKYYDKVFQLAIDKRVVQTTLDRNGRVVVITIPT